MNGTWVKLRIRRASMRPVVTVQYAADVPSPLGSWENGESPAAWPAPPSFM